MPIWKVTHCFIEEELELHASCCTACSSRSALQCYSCGMSILSVAVVHRAQLLFTEIQLYMWHIFKSWNLSSAFKSSGNYDNPAFAKFYSFLNVVMYIIVTWRIVMLLIHPPKMFCLLSCCTEEGRTNQTIQKIAMIWVDDKYLYWIGHVCESLITICKVWN